MRSLPASCKSIASWTGRFPQRCGSSRTPTSSQSAKTTKAGSCVSSRSAMKFEMERNERYAEGEATREAFAQFCNLALSAPAMTLERIINRPIYPSRVELLR